MHKDIVYLRSKMVLFFYMLYLIQRFIEKVGERTISDLTCFKTVETFL